MRGEGLLRRGDEWPLRLAQGLLLEGAQRQRAAGGGVLVRARHQHHGHAEGGQLHADVGLRAAQLEVPRGRLPRADVEPAGLQGRRLAGDGAGQDPRRVEAERDVRAVRLLAAGRRHLRGGGVWHLVQGRHRRLPQRQRGGPQEHALRQCGPQDAGHRHLRRLLHLPLLRAGLLPEGG